MSLSHFRSLGLFKNSSRSFSGSVFRLQTITSDSINPQSSNNSTSTNNKQNQQQVNYDIISERPSIPSKLTKQNFGGDVLIKPTLIHEQLRNPELERLRIVPKLETFFGGNPVHEDNLNNINRIINKHINLPTKVIDEKQLKTTRFLSFEEYKERCQSGTRLKAKHHKELTSLLHRLRSIDPELMPKDVSEVLKSFSSNKNELAIGSQTKQKTLDQFGRSFTIGKRKRSTAYVYLVKGEGQVLVNGKSLVSYFPKDTDRKKVAYPFKVVEQEGQFNIFAEVKGGGITGQIDAIMYGISKGLIIHNPLFKSRLHKSGLMTRDLRKVERKKPGKVKARKSPTWVKR